jgi:hypothetical protein
MAKRKDEEPPEPQPVMHTGSDTPEGQRDLGVSEQIARDAGQAQGSSLAVGPGSPELAARIAELEQRLRDLGEDPGTAAHRREITDSVGTADSTE